MTFKIKTWLRATFAAAAVTCCMAPSLAAGAYPDRAVTWVVPYAPGAATDALARLLAQEMTTHLGQSIVVENQPGAATITAATQLKRASADGYRLMSADITTLVLNPALRPDLAYAPMEDFTMIGMLARLPLVLVARPDLPVDTITDFIEHIKTRPGELSFASPGQGSPHHLAMELLQAEAGVSMLHVPYSGTGPSMVDILASRIDVMFASVGAVASQLASGKLKALGISSQQAFPTLPDVVPLQRADARLQNFEAYAWQGLVGPAGLPESTVDTLNQAIQATLKNPEVMQKMADLGLEPIASTPVGLKDYVADQTDIWQALVKEKKLSLE